MRDYPKALPRIDQVEPVPRRIRAIKDGLTVVDSRAAHYVFEWAYYPQFYLPLAAVSAQLIPTGRTERTSRGLETWHDLDTGRSRTADAGRVLTEAVNPQLQDTIRFEWSALDRWFEEDEEVFVHPRNPYTRVDALRSSARVRVEVGGVVLAESTSPVLVFETGLPTRYYLDKTDVRFEHLVATELRTECPYKGRTTEYWNARAGGVDVADAAWCYEFPTRQLLPVAGLVAFLNERVDLFIDGKATDRPRTKFS